MVNWNGSKDTIGCITSLLQAELGDTFGIYVVDNQSRPSDVDTIRQWLGQLAGAPPSVVPVQALHSLDSRIASADEYQVRGLAGAGRVVLVRNDGNHGFAVANNIGCKVAAYLASPEFYWLLNNDTEIEPAAPRLLVELMRRRPEVGMCGASLLFFDTKKIVQAYGGVAYSYRTGRGKHIGAGATFDPATDGAAIERQMTYVSGASMFVRDAFIQQVGPMSEEYFLYNEEADWAWRARGRFALAVEPKAVVYHKEGASIGTESQERPASVLSDFFQTRNKLMFARRYTPQYLPLIWGFLFLRCLKRAKAGFGANAKVIREVLFGRRSPDPQWFVRR